MRCLLATAVLTLGVLSSARTGWADAPVGKRPVPSQKSQAAAIELAREVFAKPLASAKSFGEKRELARRILAAAGEVQDSTERFVLLRAARNIAAEAGDVENAVWVIDELDRWYQIDRRAMLIEALTTAAKASRIGDKQRLSIAEKLLSAVEQSIARGEVRQARELLSKALDVSRRSRDEAVRKQIADRARTHHAVLTKYKGLPEALQTLRANPADPNANLLVGRYHALVRGDWRRALAHFEQSESLAFRAIAAQERLDPQDAASQVRIGDSWWSLAAQENGFERSQLLRRADHWYRTALPNLPPGLTRMKVAERLERPAAPQPAIDAARDFVEELAKKGDEAIEARRIAADRARREAEREKQRELRRQIAELRRRDIEQANAERRELALRELEARARVAEAQFEALEEAWRNVRRRVIHYPVNHYYVYPRVNYFYRVPLLGYYYRSYRVKYWPYRTVSAHHHGHRHWHH